MITPKRTRGLRFFKRSPMSKCGEWMDASMNRSGDRESNSSITGKKFSINWKTLKSFVSAKIEVKSLQQRKKLQWWSFITQRSQSNTCNSLIENFLPETYVIDQSLLLRSSWLCFRDCCTIVSRSPVDRALNFSDRIEDKRVGERTERDSIEFLFLDGF